MYCYTYSHKINVIGNDLIVLNNNQIIVALHNKHKLIQWEITDGNCIRILTAKYHNITTIYIEKSGITNTYIVKRIGDQLWLYLYDEEIIEVVNERNVITYHILEETLFIHTAVILNRKNKNNHITDDI